MISNFSRSLVAVTSDKSQHAIVLQSKTERFNVSEPRYGINQFSENVQLQKTRKNRRQFPLKLKDHAETEVNMK